MYQTSDSSGSSESSDSEREQCELERELKRLSKKKPKREKKDKEYKKDSDDSEAEEKPKKGKKEKKKKDEHDSSDDSEDKKKMEKKEKKKKTKKKDSSDSSDKDALPGVPAKGQGDATKDSGRTSPAPQKKSSQVLPVATEEDSVMTGPETSGPKQETKFWEAKNKRKEADADVAVEDEAGEILGECKQAEQRVLTNRQAAEIMFTTLEVDPANATKDWRKKAFGGFVNLMFLLVLVGCEIDLIGFALAFGDYWYMDVVIIQILLITMPCGYLFAVFFLCRKAPEKNKNAILTWARKKLKVMDLKFYHFVPIFRYFLVIKEKTAEDVEATFRVNSLSSFTLGVAEISGMMFLLYIQKQEMTLFVKINIISQGINWFITILYFLTPVSAKMFSQLHLASLNEKTDDDLREKYMTYLHLLVRASNIINGKEDQKARQDVEDFEASVDAEIFHISALTKRTLALDQVDMKAKLEALRLLRRKEISLFARIVG
eukprot:gnl/MRDRNA2_/MRDRNA2_86493_c0_seq1.p1 gnl/MRDRNA2_/MRDRNA2_86493_c0~~gnl/MRDRNA2_/MRDRNA2_86493_c0_seq1.p1  ORF type:complete len:489 (-),score=136.69 gnl/MRDRNA2_/MRDRNA2_86493_c0_seq1:477-1943(-)